MENEVAMPKSRKYVKRVGEFNDLTVGDMLGKRDEVNNEIRDINKKLKDFRKSTPSGEEVATSPEIRDLGERLKDLKNIRTRVYKRLRDLGHNARELRLEAAEKKREERAAKRAIREAKKGDNSAEENSIPEVKPTE